MTKSRRSLLVILVFCGQYLFVAPLALVYTATLFAHAIIVHLFVRQPLVATNTALDH